MEFEVKMTLKTLYAFQLRRAYTGFSGWFGIAIGGMVLALYFTRDNKWALAGGILLILWEPWTLFVKSLQRLHLTPGAKKPLHYLINDEGITVTQGEAVNAVAWGQLFKISSNRKYIYVYTSPVYSWIIPRECVGGNIGELARLVETHMDCKLAHSPGDGKE